MGANNLEASVSWYTVRIKTPEIDCTVARESPKLSIEDF